MQQTATRQFITAVMSVGRDILGAGHPLISKIEAAGTTVDAETVDEIQKALSALPEETRDTLMSAVHKHMREDISAIWGQLPHAESNEPN
ncbi:DNA-directed RNA polymerase specialized sigma24 family protein [Labrenzia sp. EL_126]|nr:DNA-directed RNA polymerase specialized sigma24 family protein [Labrenzia sp. EL_126]